MTREQLKTLLPPGADNATLNRLLGALHAEIAPCREEARRSAEALAAQAGELEAARAGGARLEETRRALDELRERYDRDLRAADERAFEAMVDSALREQGARSAKAARSLLDLDAIRAQPDREAAARAAVDALAHAQDTAFLFAAQPTGERRDVGGRVQGAPSPDEMLAVRAAAGLIAPR